MAVPAEKKMKYTLADCLAWEEGTRGEIIDGEAVMMAPPSTAHQLISMELARQLANFLEGRKCRVLPAPFAVRLFERAGDKPEDVQTVVEPDLSVVCDSAKLEKYGCRGAPDLVVEVLSPSTQRSSVKARWVAWWSMARCTSPPYFSQASPKRLTSATSTVTTCWGANSPSSSPWKRYRYFSGTGSAQ